MVFRMIVQGNKILIYMKRIALGSAKRSSSLLAAEPIAGAQAFFVVDKVINENWY